MAQTKRPPPKKQQSPKNASARAEARVKKAQAELKAAEAAATKQREKDRQKRAKDRQKGPKRPQIKTLTVPKRPKRKGAAAREKQTRGFASFFEAIGLLKPGRLKPMKRRKARSLGKMFAPIMNEAKFVPVKIPRKHAAKVRAAAAASGFMTTPTHVIVPREGYRKKMRVVIDAKGEARIKRTAFRDGKERKGGKIKGLEEEETIPLFTMAEMQKPRERLRREAAKFGKLKTGKPKYERIAFRTNYNGRRGYSHDVHDDVEQIIDLIENTYKIKEPFQTDFFRTVSIVKTTPAWRDEHPTPAERVKRRKSEREAKKRAKAKPKPKKKTKRKKRRK